MSGDLAAVLMGILGLGIYAGFVIRRKKLREKEKEQLRADYGAEEK